MGDFEIAGIASELRELIPIDLVSAEENSTLFRVFDLVSNQNLIVKIPPESYQRELDISKRITHFDQSEKFLFT